MKSIDERLEALTTNLELQAHETADLRKLIQTDTENIRALVRIAEFHERRLTMLEDGNQ